ncbi:MAG TPA: hypothetical protein VLV89_05295 [Candidatus Acidoferrum sp.]|nr:hypothetical protein [Candidatus Acidoferrum sp.]
MRRNKVLGVLALFLAAAGFVAIAARAQDKQPAPDSKREVSLKVQVVFEEYDGQKKIASLPYTFRVVSNGNNSSIRDGLRVPIITGGSASDQANHQFQYMDVGANMDCNAWPAEEGAYKIKLNVQRTFLFSPDELKPAMDLNKAMAGAGGNPVVQTFNSSFFLLMHDNQTIEAASVTNPLNGRVLKVLVTLLFDK